MHIIDTVSIHSGAKVCLADKSGHLWKGVNTCALALCTQLHFVCHHKEHLFIILNKFLSHIDK